MFAYFYEWMERLAFYMVLITAVLQAVPDKGYKKYIRFFTGLVLVLMLAAPVLRAFGEDTDPAELLEQAGYEEEFREFELSAEMPEVEEGAEKEGKKEVGEIEVEEIRID